MIDINYFLVSVDIILCHFVNPVVNKEPALVRSVEVVCSLMV